MHGRTNMAGAKSATFSPNVLATNSIVGSRTAPARMINANIATIPSAIADNTTIMWRLAFSRISCSESINSAARRWTCGSIAALVKLLIKHWLPMMRRLSATVPRLGHVSSRQVFVTAAYILDEKPCQPYRSERTRSQGRTRGGGQNQSRQIIRRQACGGRDCFYLIDTAFPRVSQPEVDSKIVVGDRRPALVYCGQGR